MPRFPSTAVLGSLAALELGGPGAATVTGPSDGLTATRRVGTTNLDHAASVTR